MHIGDSEEEAAFRSKARAWLTEHAPLDDPPHSDDLDVHVAAARDWARTLFDHGWAGLAWPKAFGGQGESPMMASIFAQEMAEFSRSLGPLTVSLGMVGPTLMRHGTREQQAHLTAILKGEEVWCQLFSEPNAGSDLAALATRAELDGDEWVVNGQKVWTSLGQFAQYGILLARTDVDVPKHKGITYFMVDMTTPGIEVRPLVQMTGVAHFNETFLTDVRIPAANVIGEINEGWGVARTTLTAERSSIAGGKAGWSAEALIALAQDQEVNDDPVVRQGLVQSYIRGEIMNLMGYRLRTAMSQQKMPGPEALTLKLGYARHWSKTMDTAMSILGPAGMVDDDPTMSSTWHMGLLNQYAVRLGGGTDEVQQNIIAELGLGLPREPSTDRGLAWKDLPK